MIPPSLCGTGKQCSNIDPDFLEAQNSRLPPIRIHLLFQGPLTSDAISLSPSSEVSRVRPDGTSRSPVEEDLDQASSPNAPCAPKRAAIGGRFGFGAACGGFGFGAACGGFGFGAAKNPHLAALRPPPSPRPRPPPHHPPTPAQLRYEPHPSSHPPPPLTDATSTASPSSHHRALTFLSPPLFPSPHHRRFTLPLTTAFPLPHHGCHSERTGPRTHQGPQSAQRFGVGSGVVSRRICISRSRVATPDRSPLSTASPSSDRGRHSERTGAPNVPWAPKTRSDLG